MAVGTLGFRRTCGLGLWVSAAALVLSASSGAAPAQTPPVISSAAPPASASASVSPPRPVAIALVPPDRTAGFAPGEPIRVTATDGKLTEVALTTEDGTPLAGQLAADGRSWSSTEPLGYGKTYTTTATGQGTDGRTATTTSTFSTATARRKATVSMNPLDGQTVGVGQPLAFYFDTAIADRAAAERAIQITTMPAVEGAFRWFGDRQVMWRPKDFWTSGTKITINAAVYGKNLGNGVYGEEDRRAAVTVGDSVFGVADGRTHQMIVTVNGTVARTIPISMGKPGHETPQGTYVVMSEHTDYIMDSSTYGVPADSPGGYRTKIAVATRLSNSGIFYHSAPWSVRQQGHSNVSHGCINMSTDNARWLQSISNKGDVFMIQNTGGPNLDPTDGLGVWQIPWTTWKPPTQN